MRKTLLMAAVLVSGSTFAAQTTESDMSQTSGSMNEIHKGLRVSVGTGGGDWELEFEGNGNKISFNEDAKSYLDISIGYESIKNSEFSYSVIGNYQQYEIGSGMDFSHLQVEGNATYGFGPQLYTSFGGHLSSISVDGDVVSETKTFYEDFSTGFGLQAALGFKVIDSLSLEGKYGVTAFAQEINGVDATLTKSLLQLNLVGTF